jgi:uncharacterized protein YceK
MRWIAILIFCALTSGCATTRTHISVHTPARGDMPEVTVGVTFDNWSR